MFSRRVQAAATRGVSFGASSLQGRRPSQEDRYTTIEQLAPGCGFYAVYDGHGGERAAVFASAAMQARLQASPGFGKRDYAAGLLQAFSEVERDFLALAERDGLSDGTTAVVALVEPTVLTVAHVGDSRGVLCRGGAAVPITDDHKPEVAAERRRIEALGGFVSYIGCWRAMGILAMSRAIGDLFLKPYVSAVPDVKALPLEESDEFVVLASDGLFDVFDNEQVVRIVRAADDPQHAASLLTKSALAAGSLDNITAIVVALRGYRPRQIDAHSPAELATATAAQPRAAAAAAVAAATAATHAASASASAASTAAASTASAAAAAGAAAASALCSATALGGARSAASSGPPVPTSHWQRTFDAWHAAFVAVEGC
eukprot:CAMPEP_0202778220 /NCGR_PEP_ID=MMETSP1388-20130828/54215_1 /ASSEMBLY_ACC=CAM_ASM_000864 /TAXON_ID=37098 /ORGANISM="Isochrysis sp, Strain CCMP1244" /LENGTH=372 /DNA_ID=CAMNT_0049447481 /DNA_START=32 /DNA_END=1150 /DNA_ORIENTATION=-